MSGEKPKGEKFMKKAERELCWAAKDKFWDCLKSNNEDVSYCLKTRNQFTEACPPTWVTHFDRKFQYEKYKQKLLTDGFQPHDETFVKNSDK